jgi:hypothetical protein
MPPVGPDGPGKTASGPRAPAAPGGHTFSDLVGSDHAELELLDADGNVAMSFWVDYLSAAASALSGYASLGTGGGEGRLSVGKPAWILATTTSLDRNLNACGLASFVTDSPATDTNYTPNPDASAWDYRVSYEVWISSEAFGDAGFGTALIQLVHASPSKQGGATLDVVPGSCPANPDGGDAPEPLPPVLETIR